MSQPIELSQPEDIARLRHALQTALNQIIGYAQMVRRQARDQSAGKEAALMERVLAPAHQLVEIVRYLLPPKSHVPEGDLARLRANTSARLEPMRAALASFETSSGGACAREIARISAAIGDLARFGAAGRQERTPPRLLPEGHAIKAANR